PRRRGRRAGTLRTSWREPFLADVDGHYRTQPMPRQCPGIPRLVEHRIKKSAFARGRNMIERVVARAARLVILAALIVAVAMPASAQQEPIKIGFGMALTGGLAANGKSALVAMQIWGADTNAKGGLLGRPVKLVFYDDQSTPSTVPGIYTKLLDVDKVEL